MEQKGGGSGNFLDVLGRRGGLTDVSAVVERFGFLVPKGCHDLERCLGNRSYNSEVGNSMGGSFGDASESSSFRHSAKR